MKLGSKVRSRNPFAKGIYYVVTTEINRKKEVDLMVYRSDDGLIKKGEIYRDVPIDMLIPHEDDYDITTLKRIVDEEIESDIEFSDSVYSNSSNLSKARIDRYEHLETPCVFYSDINKLIDELTKARDNGATEVQVTIEDFYNITVKTIKLKEECL